MASQTDIRKESHPTSPTRIVALLGLLFTIAMIVFATAFADNKHMVLLLQTFSGNWSPPNDFNEISKFEFAITAVIAIIINWGTLIAAFVLIFKYLKRIFEEDIVMPKLKQIFDIEEIFLQEAILKRIGDSEENQKKLKEAFAEAYTERDKAIEEAFGKKAAISYKKMTDRDVG
ncbi:hypothetical protein L6Q21_08645 [Sandaracinobacter sp. RS1-74]|uniref:hypothetical protein n=1 Tax=Sandaracinobacteroides sayramensis TaxID=2913411 RepID=UPI001EDC5500|nr:hypothetical protein [Sandaracinobacteroides sayramensis]MCG2841049.1 hypothetical protein [Sandaracinobacteroides sayramensis]